MFVILPTRPQQLHTGNGLYLSAEEVLHLAKAWEKGKEEKNLIILDISGKRDLQENRRKKQP